MDFIQRQQKAGKPFFVWVNFTHMHFRTHTKPESIGQSGRWESPYHDTMIDHDKNVGTVLKALDDLGIADNTFVMYSTDNGPHMNSWPDGAMTPFRSEKNTSWEGAYRVPAMFRWPGKIKPGQVSNEIVAHLDMLPTILAMAGDTQVKDKLLAGYKVGDMTYKVHLDGDNLVPYLTGQVAKSPRRSFFYINDDQQLTALRYDNWKLLFLEQRAPGTMLIWANPFTNLRVPKIFNLRTDPYERADVTSNTYYDWLTGPRLHFGPCAGLRRSVPDDVQRLPAAAEGGQLQHGRGPREAEGSWRRLRWSTQKIAADRDPAVGWQQLPALGHARRVDVIRESFKKVISHAYASHGENCAQTGTNGRRAHWRFGLFYGRFAGRRPFAVVERRPGEAIHHQLCREGHHPRLAGLRPGCRAHRNFRQRRHAVERAAVARAIIFRA